METTSTYPLPLSTINLLQSSLSFITPGAVIDIHHHHCFQLCLALNQPFDCQVGDTRLTSTWGFIVNQTIPHSCNAPQTLKLVQFIEPDSIWGKALKALLNGAPFRELASLLPPENFRTIVPTDYTLRTNDDLLSHVEGFLQRLFPQPLHPPYLVQDERIFTALRYVEQNLPKKLQLDDIANLIFLSPDRTRHLFVEQTGMPFSQYVLWKRIRAIAAVVAHNQVKTADACIRYGFTDYPHFTHIFRRMFGVPPKSVLHDCRVII